jgi:hypothetical protein
MSASAVTHLPASRRHGLDRVRATHAVVDAALLAGVGSKLRFGLLRCLLIIPALTDSGGGGSTMPTTNSVPPSTPGVSPAEHGAHHR